MFVPHRRRPFRVPADVVILSGLGGGCARPPVAQGETPVIGDLGGCAGGGVVPPVQVCAGQAAKRRVLKPCSGG